MIRLALRVRREQAEIVLAELLELAPGGVEERDLGGEVEYAVYGAPGELPALPDLRARAGDALVSVRSSLVEDDWDERWRDFHRPARIGDRLLVRPPWAPAPADAGVIDLVVDPGQAFGTGAHPTTRLCLELLLELADTEPARAGRGALLDLGCGSGVLALAARRLGWAPVIAADSDPLALEATDANARASGVEGLEVRRLDLRHDALPAAPTLLANLLRPLLLELARRLEHVPDVLVVGGLLSEEADEVAGAFERRGLAAWERREDAGWAALLIRRARRPQTGHEAP